MTAPDSTSQSRSHLVAFAVAAALAACLPREHAAAGQLPVPCGGAACGANASTWVTSGNATLAQGGNTMTVNQTSAAAILNWQSFNISADGKVNFVQPSSTALAINRIYQGSVSQIFGALNSNGTVYLLNQNGILFGTGSTVNVGGLLASSLDLTAAAQQRGIAGAINQAQPGSAPVAPGPALDHYANETFNVGSVTVAPGASITANQGQILLFAPTVTNAGTLSSPNGQTILGAGQQIYLEASTDPNLRGLLIEVGGCTGLSECGTVTNTGGPGQTVGQIIATEGNVTLAGLAVQQDGRVSATTTVRANGSIRLQAREAGESAAFVTGNTPSPSESGTLTLGSSSITSVSLAGGPDDKTVDVNTQPKSQIDLIGGEIDLLDHAAVTAPSGNVTLSAVTNPFTATPDTPPAALQRTGQPDSSRIYLAPSSSIDVSGASVSESVSDNSLAVQLRGSETENFPQTRAGPLRGQTVYVDVRQHGTNSDGSSWVGTPLADLSGDISAVQRDVFERNLTGGAISFSAGGSVVVSPGATLNVSGGQIDWQAGYVKSSVLVAPNGQLTPISEANPNVAYLGTLDTISQGDPHWGTVANVTLPGYNPLGVYQPAYVEGKDAGSISITAPAFVLDGTVSAGAVTGPLQRVPTDPNFAAHPYYPDMMYRFPDQMPLGGTLTLGDANMLNLSGLERGVLKNLTFSDASALATLTGPAGGAFDPLHDPLPDDFVSTVRPDLFAAGNLTQLSVYADGTVSLPAGITLAPGPGAHVTLTGGTVDVAGGVVSNGGSVTLESIPTVLFGGQEGGAAKAMPDTSLVLERNSVIDLRGAWVNDTRANGQTQFAPLYTNGGSATILAADGGLLSIASGARIDVSAGAQLTATRSVVAGSGGSIAITAGPSPGTDNPSRAELPPDLSPDLAGYALFNGGALSLTLPGLCVSSAACADPTAYRVDPDVLTSLGFGTVTLGAAPSQIPPPAMDPTSGSADAGSGVAAAPPPTPTTNALVVASDVDVLVRQRNFALSSTAFNTPSASSLAGLTQVVTLPAYMRQAENLNVTTAAPTLNTPQFADISIARGAVLAFDPGAAVKLTTNSRIFFDGTLNAPAGSVQLAIKNNLLAGGGALVPNQAIWLGSGSVIDVRGTTVTAPSTSGLLLGNVLGGGGVTLDAESGYLIGVPGAQILAGGASGTLDLHPPGTNLYTRHTVASAGGSISMSAAEGIEYDGSIAAPAGGPDVSGGSLSLTLDGQNVRGNAPGFAGATFTDPRVITITASNVPTVVGEGSSVPDFLDGSGHISAQQISSGGFDNVSLTARDMYLTDPTTGTFLPPVQGAVTFAGGVSLHPAQSLIVDASEIGASGSGAVHLGSAYVRLGSTDTKTQELYAGATEGQADLLVTAGLIDLVGQTTLNGFGAVALSSSGDIRLSGVQVATGSQLAGFTGAFASPGPLTLSAQQIYPTTLSNFTIQLTNIDPTQSVLTIERAPGTPSEVLSAAGSLTLEANQILDSGIVKAPIGTLSLQAQSVSLQSGAVLSVSAADTSIPFGQTQGGFDWVYALNPSQGATTVYGTGTGDTTLPSKQISISAGDFQLQPGATIDMSGGGDLLAYEWTPGLGGTKDVLSPTQSPGLYAVLPGASLPYAPLDPNEDRGFTTPVGSSVYLSGGAGLPAGTYALLPARYALLPGAYLVKAVSGYTDLAAGQTVSQLDGSTIVSGYHVNAATRERDARTSGFDIVSGAYALDSTQSTHTLAQYSVTGANTFFTSQAKTNDVTTPRLPADAGSLAINVTGSAQLQGALAATAPNGYRGGSVDITAPDLFVTGKPVDAPAGTVVLDVNQLNQLGAESLLLGATRSSTNNYTQLHVPQDGSGNVVEIDADTALEAPEVILAASNTIQLDAGASVAAVGAVTGAEPDLIAPVGTAVVRVSTGAQLSLNPVAGVQALGPLPVGLDGAVKVLPGASISAPGSVSIDAGGSVDFSGGLSAAGAAVRLGAQQLALGAAPAGFAGFAIGSNLVSGLLGANLTLQVSDPSSTDYGARAIRVYGPVQLNLSSLTLDAPGLVAATADGDLTISAQNVTLSSGSSQPYASGTAVPAMTGPSLAINAAHVSLSDGTFGVDGYATTAITASQDLTLTGNGTLGVTGAFNISSPILQSAAGKTYQLVAAGDLATVAPSGAAAAPTSLAGPGGAISFIGSTVTLGGNVVLPGGRITANSTDGPVNVISGAVLDVSGFSENFDGEVRSANGGTVSLTATGGDIGVASGSVIDVSAGSGGGSGGALYLTAPTGNVDLAGTVRGAGAAGSIGGSLLVDAQQLDFGGLVAAAGSAGFTSSVSLHQRGPGDFVLSSGTLQAQDVELTADQGAVTVDSGAVIDARAALGGNIVLAGQSIDVGGTLLAGATGSSTRGGSVELLSGGVLVLDSGSAISVGGTSAAATGTVWLRAPEQAVMNVLSGDSSLPQVSLDPQASITGAQSITLEAYSYASPDLSPGSQNTAPVSLDFGTLVDPASAWYSGAQSLVSSAAQIAAQLHQSTNAAFSILPGLEIDTQGDLHVASNWDFSTVRFSTDPGGVAPANVPGVLTVRAAGNLYVDNSISDGFNGLGSTLSSTPSWSYRLTAGADLGSTNPLAVAVNSVVNPDAGSIIVAPGTPPPSGAGNQSKPGTPKMIRTGTGFIDIAGAGDLQLGNQASVIYTAGSAGTGKTFGASRFDGGVYPGLQLPQDGGNVHVAVGGDIVGAPSTQLFNDWLFRGGQSGSQPSAWAPAFAFFEQGIGALGGGDLTIVAGGNISDLGAVVPSTGVPGGSSAPTVEQNSGMLTVRSGGDILGGKFLDMAGDASITAGGAVRTGTPQSVGSGDLVGLNLILGLGSGRSAVTTRSDLMFEAGFEVTLLPRATSQFPAFGAYASSIFGTFTDSSSLTLQSTGGALTYTNRSDIIGESDPSLQKALSGGNGLGLQVLPPTFAAVALGGDVTIGQVAAAGQSTADRSLGLWPAPHGSLDLLASGAITLTNAGIRVSDADPATLPGVNSIAPIISGALSVLDATSSAISTVSSGLHANQPLHGGTFASDGQPDDVPVRIVALSGDLTQISTQANVSDFIDVPKPLDIVAGGNIVNLQLDVQQLTTGNVSSITAGGNITYPFARDSLGALVPNNSGINIAGPGELDIQAGGTINLGTSAGISSIGNLYNPALPAAGADISVAAGITQIPHYQDFINAYLVNESTYDRTLEQYVTGITGNQDLTKAEALSAFAGLTTAQQTPLLETVFFDEIRAGGRSAAAPGSGHDNYTRAFTALTTLFPDAANDTRQGQTLPYSGDILLYFSRVYTLAGGNINLLAPGGQVNVGLAVAPTSFGVDKAPSQLGIVAQSTGSDNILAYSDIEVNQSRVFAADGGDILMWSTFGSIDAGRGAKTAISAPPPVITIDANGKLTLTYPAALLGSGIQALATTAGVSPGDVDLFAPNGVVNANDAGIVAGNLTIAATAVLGSNNITVSGTAVGLPPPAVALGAVTAGASSSSSAAGTTAEANATQSGNSNADKAPKAQETLNWLEVFVLGLGEGDCKPDDLECIKKQQKP